MTASERARLLALDRRTPRNSEPGQGGHYGRGLWEKYCECHNRAVRMQLALRDLLAWHDAPPQGWTAGMIRRLDEIRALAATENQ